MPPSRTLIRKPSLKQLLRFLNKRDQIIIRKNISSRFEFNELGRKRLSLIDFIIEHNLKVDLGAFIQVSELIKVDSIA